MKIYTCHFHPNGFFMSCDSGKDFWFFLGPLVGWGRFTQIREDTEFTHDGGLFGLCEVLPAGSKPPSSVAGASNVLWRLPEALAVSQRAPFSVLQEDSKEAEYLRELQSRCREFAASHEEGRSGDYILL